MKISAQAVRLLSPTTTTEEIGAALLILAEEAFGARLSDDARRRLVMLGRVRWRRMGPTICAAVVALGGAA